MSYLIDCLQICLHTELIVLYGGLLELHSSHTVRGIDGDMQ
jgi:hypothetical protein